MSQKIKTAFIVRFHYEENDPRFEWRFSYFKDHVLPRILAQQGHKFDIAIRCNPVHDKKFEQLSERIRVFHVQDEKARYKVGSNGQRYFLDFVDWADVIDLPRYELQLGLDSDDLIYPGYLDRVMELVRLSPREPMHICFQPELVDVKTGEAHPIRQRYTTEKGSAFFAIYQPAGTDPYRFAYSESHLRIGRKFPSRHVIVETYCAASCHDFNESTHL